MMRKVLSIERKFDRGIRLNVSMKMSECEKIGEPSPMMLMQPKGNETRVSPSRPINYGPACTACTTRVTSHTQLVPLIGLCGENSITKLPAASHSL